MIVDQEPLGTASEVIERVAVVGTGVIGASWVVHFLAQGLDVVATDPAQGAEQRLHEAVDAHWLRLFELGKVIERPSSQLIFEADLSKAVGSAQWVQENGPEQLAVKQALLAEIDAKTSPRVILATSSSGLSASDLQAHCTHADRVLVAHPVNPPHLLPLVEIIGGVATSAETIERAMRFYTAVGKKPIHLTRELKGHLVNRLQAALWQEMIHLVSSGAATAAQVDAAMKYAIGPRWAAEGPFINLHLSGGAGGLRRVLEPLGPAMQSWWRDLGRTVLTPEIIDRVVASTKEIIGEESVETLATKRDSAVMRILDASTGTGVPKMQTESSRQVRASASAKDEA